MWRVLKILGFLIKTLFWLTLLLACLTVVLLYVLEHGLPRSVVNQISEKLSSEKVIVDIGRINFNLKSGLHLHDVKAYPRKLAAESFGTVEDVIIKFSLAPGCRHTERLESVTLKNIDSPHHPRRILRKLAAMDALLKKEEKPRKKIPVLAPFTLMIEDSHVVGFKAKTASALVSLNDPVITLENIILQWPDTTRAMQLAGRVYLYLDSEQLDGYASGEAFPENVTGFLKELGVRTVLRELDRFSAITEPVKVDCGFKVDLDNSDFAIDIDLQMGSCAYRGVPLKYARGNIKAYGTNNVVWADIQGLETESSAGKLAGALYYDETDMSLKVNALSTMPHRDVTTIIDILTHGELNPVIIRQPPVVTAVGTVAVATNALIQHNLTGKASFGEASVFGLNVTQASCDYSVLGEQAFLKDVKATTPSGGTVTGSAVFSISQERDTSPAIVAQTSFLKVDLSDLVRIFSMTNTRAGECSGNLQLSGFLGTNQLHRLNGQGDFRIENGQINQLKLFAGLTDYMSRNIPGISSLVNQSECSLKFSIKDGILTTENFAIEGDVFNINGKGSYDIPRDRIDLTVHVALFRRQSIAGRITRLVTFPFKKLLLEFKVYGSSDEPQWTYVTILEKIIDQIDGSDSEKEPETK